MSTERDTTRIVRSWLRTDEHESADRVLDNVFALLDATPQRRAWWPARRIAEMNVYARLGIAIAAVVVVAVAGFTLLPAVGGVGGPVATPTPIASPSPAPTPTPSPTAAPTPTPTPAPASTAVFPPTGPLEIGRHEFNVNGVPFSLELTTDGWTSNGSWGLDKGDAAPGPDGYTGAGFILWQDPPIGVYSDPCSGTEGEPPGSLDGLMAAVASIPGIDLVSGPADVTVGGYPAKRVVIKVRDDIGCDPSSFYLWYGNGPGNARYATEVGETMRSWAIDVDGSIVWIDGETYVGSSSKVGKEVQNIIGSIQFE
jgi:hypothetical protein